MTSGFQTWMATRFVRALRGLESLANTTFVAITGYASDSDKIAAMEAGFDAHMTKPVDATSLEALLQRASGSKQSGALTSI